MQLSDYFHGISQGGDFLSNRTAKQVITQAISDFDCIKEAIIGHKIPVPYGTATSVYASLIASIRVGGISGNAYCNIKGTVFKAEHTHKALYIDGDIIAPVIGHIETPENI